MRESLTDGSDPLPFQWLARKPDLCQNVRFVDVDYRELMITKTSIVVETPVLKELVMPDEGASFHFVLESERYYGVGCDLRDLRSVDSAIRSLRGIDEALVLCIAEVSVTYMDPDAADLLIAWARTLSDGKSAYQCAAISLLTRRRCHIWSIGANSARWPGPSVCEDNAETFPEASYSTPIDSSIS